MRYHILKHTKLGIETFTVEREQILRTMCDPHESPRYYWHHVYGPVAHLEAAEGYVRRALARTITKVVQTFQDEETP